MSEWGVVGVIIALLGLIVTVVTPVVKLNTTIVKLTAIVENLSGDVAELTTRNTKTHDRLFDHLAKHDDILSDHETRIQIIETEMRR